ncbi:Zinc knuckle CX2CX4HX4C [Sesbania bispinosa]|nr:Zinc knuckle CX2CX4HX4C [Sesbania bispinosa]
MCSVPFCRALSLLVAAFLFGDIVAHNQETERGNHVTDPTPGRNIHADKPNNPNNDEPPIVIFDDSDIDDGVDFCLRSLVGKILTDKPIHSNSLQNTLSGIWCNPKGFRVEEISNKTYQFFFYEEKDAIRVLKGNPCIFRNSWINLKRWERDTKIENLDFSKVPINIQLWGLPAHCKTSKMGRKLGACMGEVTSSGIFEVKERGSFIKLQVVIDCTKPLKPRIHAGSCRDGVFWVEFQYEKLPQFCYSCRLIGHSEEYCVTTEKDEEDKEDNKSSLGPWMRTPHPGRRLVNFIDEAPDNAHQKYHKQTPSLPTEVLSMLSALLVNKEEPPTKIITHSTVENHPLPESMEAIRRTNHLLTQTLL